MMERMIVERHREGQKMGLQEEKASLENEPEVPDEGWWSAVLADEEQFGDFGDAEDEDDGDTQQPSKITASQSEVDWDKVSAIYSGDEIIDLKVIGLNRGGLLVADDEIHGFVPASHLIDVPANIAEEDREFYLSNYLERTIALKVIECDPEKERVVFSERAALAGEGQRKRLLNRLSTGDIVTGVVTNITSFGAFVDLGGLEGLIHVSELSWGRVQHPADIVSINDEVKTIVLDVSEDQGRIALSLKQLQANPWKLLAKTLSPGDVISAEIASIVKYGAFARLNQGIEGLIHISSMNFPEDCTHINDFLFVGQAVEVCVLNIDAHKRRLGLKLESY